MQRDAELQTLERLCLKYPDEAMQTLSLRGVDKFIKLYKEATGLDLYCLYKQYVHKNQSPNRSRFI